MIEVGHSNVVYDAPGPPYHPVDAMFAELAHERRMQEIREMDIQAWAAQQIDE